MPMKLVGFGCGVRYLKLSSQIWVLAPRRASLCATLPGLPRFVEKKGIKSSREEICTWCGINFMMVNNTLIDGRTPDEERDEEAQIDSICECVRDFKDAYQKVRKTDEERKEEAMQEWFSVTLKDKLQLFVA